MVAKEYPEHQRMLKLATHNAAHLLDTMEFHEDLRSALKPFPKSLEQLPERDVTAGLETVQEIS